jgi:TRAP-type uncharacterized transport system fused permease subunit
VIANVRRIAWYEHRFAVLSGSFLLYIAACYLPAILLHTGSYHYSDVHSRTWVWHGYQSLRGVDLLIAGLFGILMGNFAWLANPLLCISWLLLMRRQYDSAALVSGFALIIAMATFQLTVQPYYFDEGGVNLGYLHLPQSGFYLWIGSMASVFIPCLCARYS